jgi:hypothetical protein
MEHIRRHDEKLQPGGVRVVTIARFSVSQTGCFLALLMKARFRLRHPFEGDIGAAGKSLVTFDEGPRQGGGAAFAKDPPKGDSLNPLSNRIDNSLGCAAVAVRIGHARHRGVGGVV